MDKELTDAETERIDRIQSLTHDFIANLIPDEKKRQEYEESGYDFDAIDAVLQTVWEHIEDKAGCTEREFYPYRDSDEQ